MRVGPAERPFLAAEAEALAEQLPDGQTREALTALASLEADAEVPEELVERVGDVAALSVETGRASAVHGPAGVRALNVLWKDSPQGRRASAEARELEQALSALRGRPVEAIRVSATGPGAHSIAVAAGGYELRLTVDRSGIRLRGINVGGGGVGE